ncbi:hypothetical protein ERJ75_001827000 [Trypanosoma vivax]|uniref:Uncharacterized protein n=1 Tax=Trypanosoma vivax (strain Y486) TaxID=1055687 RepID=G0U903_TRYVY|nr:hypothetical protein TRVL_04104 [Trypanosoma vivax]KAH8603433.1 hypothetical protein ERJ75_001827000 [Trypanosoma vivax]CCC54086.1 conserved hypothetical protein [Trypanosoma vivax Y486]
MEREKLVWASFGLVGIIVLVYVQHMSSQNRNPPRRSRSQRTHHRAPSPMAVDPNTLARKNDFPGSLYLGAEKPTGSRASSSRINSVRSREASPSLRDFGTNNAVTARKLAYECSKFNGTGSEVGTARHSSAMQRSFGSHSSPVPKPLQGREIATQTDGCAWDELNHTETAAALQQSDPIHSISPIVFDTNDLSSPTTHDCVSLFGSTRPPLNDNQSFTLHQSLEDNLGKELVTLVEAVRVHPFELEQWFELYTFLIELPLWVLQRILKAREGFEIAPTHCSKSVAGDRKTKYLYLLQQEVCGLLKGESSRYAGLGRFKLEGEHRTLVWHPTDGRKLAKIQKIPRLTSCSSDDEAMEDDSLNAPQRVEKLLRHQRQGKSCSLSVQVPNHHSTTHTEAVSLNTPNPNVTRQTAFEETDTRALLNDLVVLGKHPVLASLQHSSSAASFLKGLSNLVTNAQRLLDGSVAGIKRTPNVHTPDLICFSSTQVSPLIDMDEVFNPLNEYLGPVNVKAQNGTRTQEHETAPANGLSETNIKSEENVVDTMAFGEGRSSSMHVSPDGGEQDGIFRVLLPSPMFSVTAEQQPLRAQTRSRVDNCSVTEAFRSQWSIEVDKSGGVSQETGPQKVPSLSLPF